jgi:hypothetical protein
MLTAIQILMRLLLHLNDLGYLQLKKIQASNDIFQTHCFMLTVLADRPAWIL